MDFYGSTGIIYLLVVCVIIIAVIVYFAKKVK